MLESSVGLAAPGSWCPDGDGNDLSPGGLVPWYDSGTLSWNFSLESVTLASSSIVGAIYLV